MKLYYVILCIAWAAGAERTCLANICGAGHLRVSDAAAKGQPRLQALRGFSCETLHHGEASGCVVVVPGDALREPQIYRTSWQAAKAERLTRYEARQRVSSAPGIKVECEGAPPLTFTLKKCYVSQPLSHQGWRAAAPPRELPLYRLSSLVEHGRLRFVGASTRGAMKVRCSGMPVMWLKKIKYPLKQSLRK